MLHASREAVESLLDDVRYLWDADVPVYHHQQNDDPTRTALHFLRHHVARSRPCIIRGALPTVSWSTMRDVWPDDLPLQVDVTPDGHGDCLRRVVERRGEDAPSSSSRHQNDDDDARCYFVKPMECQMSMNEFVEAMETNREPIDPDHIRERVFVKTTEQADATSSSPPPPPADQGVVYYSRQNDCLRTELQPLWKRLQSEHGIPATLDWAAPAFDDDAGTRPDAVNLWMGPPHAVSAWHKDPYENLFHVLHGTKVFALIPPACAPLLNERPVPSGRFAWRRDDDDADENSTRDWRVVIDDDDDATTVPWITVDPLRSDDDAGLYDIPVRHVRVNAGDTLYLPALWFHRVTQRGDDRDDDVTIGLNYWYDMTFESPLWVYFSFMQQLRLVRPGHDDDDDNDDVGDDDNIVTV